MDNNNELEIKKNISSTCLNNICNYIKDNNITNIRISMTKI